MSFIVYILLVAMITTCHGQQNYCETEIKCEENCSSDIVLCADVAVPSSEFCNIIMCTEDSVMLTNGVKTLASHVSFNLERVLVKSLVLNDRITTLQLQRGPKWVLTPRSSISLLNGRLKTALLSSVMFEENVTIPMQGTKLYVEDSMWTEFPLTYKAKTLTNVSFSFNNLGHFPAKVLQFINQTSWNYLKLEQHRSDISYRMSGTQFSILQQIVQDTNAQGLVPRHELLLPQRDRQHAVDCDESREELRSITLVRTALQLDVCVHTMADHELIAAYSTSTNTTDSNNSLVSTMEPTAMDSSESTESSSILVIIIVAVGIAVLVVIVFVAIWMRKSTHQEQEQEQQQELELELDGELEQTHNSQQVSNSDDEQRSPQMQYINYNKSAMKSPQSHIIPSSEIQVLDKIGNGFYGLVLLAKYDGEYVVVKKQNDYMDDEFESFRQEIELLKMLRHPNIVLYKGLSRITFDVYPELCIVCEYMPKGDLKNVLHIFNDLIQKHTHSVPCLHRSSFSTNEQLERSEETLRGQNPMSAVMDKFTWQDLKLSIAIDILKGLNYLHGLHRKIIHRDLKSPNVLLNDDFVAKIADFGTSREVSLTSTMTVIGSTLWMAPEVIAGVKFDEKADVYSFGIVLSELITHRMPYSHLNDNTHRSLHPMAIALQVANEDLRPCIQHADVCPPSYIVKLYEKCVLKDPALRPTTLEALEFLSEFACGVGGEE